MKKPAISTHRQQHEQRGVGEGDVPAEDLDRDDRMDLELVDGIGHPCALTSRLRCCHVTAPSVLVVRHLVADPAAGPGHDLLLHPLVGPHHVEDAGREPQHEEQQEQPGRGSRATSPGPSRWRPRRSRPPPARPPCACRRPCRARASRRRDRLARRPCCCALTLSSRSPRSEILPSNAAFSSGLIWRWPGPRSSAGSGIGLTSSAEAARTITQLPRGPH